MTRYTVAIAAFGIAFSATVPSGATTLPTPGPAPPGSAIAYYYTWSGEITVSVNSVTSWFVESASDALTGGPAANLPAGGGVATDNDEVIGESAFLPITYTDFELGAVAQPFLAESDLAITWMPDIQTVPVVYIDIPEPSSFGLVGVGLVLMGTVRRRTRA